MSMQALSLRYTMILQHSVSYGIGRHFTHIEDKRLLPTGVK